jgi:hypothetical protein
VVLIKFLNFLSYPSSVHLGWQGNMQQCGRGVGELLGEVATNSLQGPRFVTADGWH